MCWFWRVRIQKKLFIIADLYQSIKIKFHQNLLNATITFFSRNLSNNEGLEVFMNMLYS